MNGKKTMAGAYSGNLDERHTDAEQHRTDGMCK